MLAFEFKATIKNGFIKISNEYQQQFEREKSVKVILMKSGNAPTQDLIGQLLSTQLEVENFSPLKREDIYD